LGDIGISPIPGSEELYVYHNTFPTAFDTLGEKDLCLGAVILEKINAALR
jgi:hypothetical protein